MPKKLPKSLRKFVRREKARIRREFFDVRIQEEKTQELLKKVSVSYNKEKGRA